VDCLLTWVRNNSSVVSAVATVVSAIAAAIIAVASVVSARIIRLERKRQKADRMPILALTEEIEQGDPSYNRALYVKNVGYGPALNIVRKIADEQLVLGSLAAGDKTFAFFRTLPSNSGVPILDEPTFRVVLECDDILDGHYEFAYENRKHFAPKPLSKRKMPSSEAHRI
jgi:hypothetical protein